MEAINHPQDYNPEAVRAAQQEIVRRENLAKQLSELSNDDILEFLTKRHHRIDIDIAKEEAAKRNLAVPEENNNMVEIKNIEGMTIETLNDELARGGKFVVFQYCISLLVITFKRSSDIYFIKAGQSTAEYSAKWTLLTLLFGWWGFPFGPIFTVIALYHNFRGGKDLTQEVIQALNK
jgi:hypothetical protein